jgi:hypothetical protein
VDESGDKPEQAPATGDTSTQAAEGDALDLPIEIGIPEGSEIPQEAVDAFLPIAKELGLNSEQATKLVEYQDKVNREAQADLTAQWKARSDQWRDSLQKDVDFGGDAYEGNIQASRRALRAFGGEPLASALGALGLGNHPELVKFFARVGRAMGEDDSSFDGGVKKGKPDAATARREYLKRQYPSMHKEGGKEAAS